MHEHLKACAAFKRVEAVEIPEISLTMHVRTASAAWQVEWEALIEKNSGLSNAKGDRELVTQAGMYELLLAGCLCDADGVRFFKDVSESRAWMAETERTIVRRLVAAAMALNGIGENVSKNSVPPQPDASLTA